MFLDNELKFGAQIVLNKPHFSVKKNFSMTKK